MNKANENYNWWKDPKNQSAVDLPISIIQSEDCWTVSIRDDQEKYLGKSVKVCCSGSSKEQAVERLFEVIRIIHRLSEEKRLNYQRWVPFRRGDWSKTGGMWFVIFGIRFYFRYGRDMKFGWFIPFTRLNISVSSEWKIYREWKKSK